MLIAPHMAWQVIDSETVLVDLPNGRVMGLNPVASVIWSLLSDHDEAAIADEVARRFEVDLATARLDVAEFIATLRQRGFLTAA
jgi:hypothetical protein